MSVVTVAEVRPARSTSARLAVVAAITTFVILGATVAGGLWWYHGALVGQLDRFLAERAEDTAVTLLEQLDATVVADEIALPFGGDDTVALVWDDVGVLTRGEIPGDDRLEWLEDADGTVVVVPAPELLDGDAGTDLLRVAVDSVDDVVIDWADPGDALAPGGGTVYVAVASSTAAITAAVRAVGLAGAGVVVLGTLGAAVLTLVVSRRALAPVERLRRESEAITASDLHRRLPEPERLDELGALARTLNSMLERLDTSQRRQQRFVSDASHELRTPVAALAGGLEVALRSPETVDWPEAAERAVAQARRLQHLIDDLLVLARIDEGAAPAATELVDLDDVVLEQVAALRVGARVPIDVGAVSSAVAVGDRQRLGQVVTNLLANAVRHAAAGVAVSVFERDGWSWVTVDDDGPGVPAAAREQVFERFARLEAARARDGGGAGLGLAICRTIARAHGGEVGVADSPLGGARFWLRVPGSLASQQS